MNQSTVEHLTSASKLDNSLYLDLEKSLDLILTERRLQTIFQPILDFSKRDLRGYEALIRGPSDSQLHNPAMLFETAVRFGRLVELEQLCRELSIQQFRRLNLKGKLFLNVVPSVLLDHEDGLRGQILSLVEQAGIDPSQIVIELTEQFPMDDYEAMRQATAHYRQMGFEIAIDDLGAGYAGLRLWSELRPHYVKIDKHFIQGIHEDSIKADFVRSLCEIAKSTQCHIIAEGIETADDCSTIYEMGIRFGQGYFIGRPHPAPILNLDQNNFILFSSDTPGNLTHKESIGSIANPSITLLPNITIKEAGKIFRESPNTNSLPVVTAENTPLGMVRRNRIMDILSSDFGLALHGKKAVQSAIEPDSIIVDEGSSFEYVSQLITSQGGNQMDSNFIITRNAGYLGIGTTLNLLKQITRLKIRNAKYANPLTLLPGNVPIYEKMDSLLAQNKSFQVAYCDLDHFKPYNDHYGYSKGDLIIKHVAKLLTQHCSHDDDFVGHVGGDDFIVIFQSPDWLERCQRILDEFTRTAPSYYTVEDQVLGGIQGVSRTNQPCFYPFISLSIGITLANRDTCKNHHDIATLASESKKQAKLLQGNSLFIDRRNTLQKA